MSRLKIAAIGCLAAIGVLAMVVSRRPRTDAGAPDSERTSRAHRADLDRKLEALGYVEEVEDDPDPERRGVVLRSEGAFPGVNYYCTGQAVRFLDMEGKLLHEMKLEVPGAPSSGCLAEPYRQGLMAVVRRPILSMSRWGSRTQWNHRGGFHHDIAVDARARLYTFAIQEDVLRRGERAFDVLSQAIVVLDGKGRILRSLDLLPLFGSLVPEDRLRMLTPRGATPATGRDPATESVRVLDIFHPNSIELVDWPHDDSPDRRALISLRDLDRVAVIDLERGRVLWEWGAGDLIGPHDPWLLPNGHVTVFDNGSRPIGISTRGYSRVVEIDPSTNSIVWQFQSDPPSELNSPSRGGAQPLPNGNILVTDSSKGRVFEITREGEVVWDFWNPDFGAADGKRKSIYRMYRMTESRFRDLQPPT